MTYEIVKYYKQGCAKCVMVNDLLAEILVDLPHVKLTSVDVDTVAADTLFAAGVRNLPTVVLLCDGVKIADTWGFKPKLIRQLVAQVGV